MFFEQRGLFSNGHRLSERSMILILVVVACLIQITSLFFQPKVLGDYLIIVYSILCFIPSFKWPVISASMLSLGMIPIVLVSWDIQVGAYFELFLALNIILTLGKTPMIGMLFAVYESLMIGWAYILGGASPTILISSLLYYGLFPLLLASTRRYIIGLREYEALKLELSLHQQREEVSRHLHDTISADLVRIKLLASNIEAHDIPENLREPIGLIEQSSNSSLSALRDFTAGPKQAEGIAETVYSAYSLSTLIAAMQERLTALNITLSFSENTPGVLSTDELSFYSAIFKEIEANIMKHADSSVPVTLMLSYAFTGTRLFCVNHIKNTVPIPELSSNSIGLGSLEHNVKSKGGSLKALCDDKEFTLTIKLPRF